MKINTYEVVCMPGDLFGLKLEGGVFEKYKYTIF